MNSRSLRPVGPRWAFAPASLLVLLPWLLAACGATPEQPAPEAAPVAQAGAVQPPPELAARLEAMAAALDAEREALHIPGLALAIVKDGQIIFARGFGLADVEQGRAVTPESLFAIGSTTKAFTSALVGMLADEGKLSLDDPITKALPWFTLPIDAKGDEQVTFRDLLSHRTGFARMDILWAGGKATREEVMRTATRAEPMAPFRKEFLYNNIMYLAAGEACAALAGRSWEELVKERLLEPLGMRATDTSVAEAQRDPHLALGYRWDGESETFVRAPMRDLRAIAPAGAINSSVLDMTHWIRFQLGRGEFEGKRLLSEASFKEAWKPHNTMSPDVRYGLGWMLRQWNGQPYVEHGGNIDGFAAEVALLPEAQLGLVLLANVGATPLQGTIGPRVFEALLGEEKPAAAEAAASAEDFARYTGTYIANYFSFHEAPFEVLVKNDRLAIDVPGQMVFELLAPGPDGKRPFADIPEAIQADFEERDGKIVALRLYQGGMTFDVPRKGYVPPPELTEDEMRPYLGSYEDPVNGKTFTVVNSRGRLACDYPGQMVYELYPPKDDERWAFRATPLLALQFHLDADDVAESVTFHERGTKRECERVGEGGLALPTLEEILALRKSAEQEAALAQLGLCRLTTTMRFVNCGIEGTSTVLFDASDRSDDTTDLSPFVWTRTVHDGKTARFQSSLEPTRDLTGASLDQSVANGMQAFFGDWSRRYDSATVERVDEIEGKRSARVRLVKGKAPAMTMHVDLATGDVFAADVNELVQGGSTYSKRLTFEDWRETDGLRLPMRMVSEDDASGRVVLEVQKFETRVTDVKDPFALPPMN